jgi:hypothetical protein
MKPYLYTKLFVPVFLFTLCAPGLCAPGLCAPAKIVRAGAASAKVSQRKQLLRYCISLGLLTSRIHDVQSAENNLLQHPYPSEGYNPQRPNDGVWARKMRAQVSYVHKLRQEAKSLTVPSVCQPANQELVASLGYLEVTFLKLYQAQVELDRARAESFFKEGYEASDKSKTFQYRFIDTIRAIEERFHLDSEKYGVDDWPTAAM